MTLANSAKKSVRAMIGNTPIVKLNTLGKDLPANFYVKCEFMNPGGSIKDRIADHMINCAERDGILKPGGTIVEATSGNTGLALAMIGGTRGYKCIFVMADKQSEEKRNALRGIGAEVVICPTDVAADDERSYYKVAERIHRNTPNSFYANQYNSPWNTEAHYVSTGPEIWQQCGTDLDILVCGVGTGGTITGISKYLKEKNKNVQVIGVDPIGSIYYDLFYYDKWITPHTYKIEGIGEDFLPEAVDLKCIDELVQVDDEQSFSIARKLVRKEGLLAGGSSGSAVLGALKYVEMNKEKFAQKKPNILIVLPDSTSRYWSKYLNDNWLKENDLQGAL